MSIRFEVPGIPVPQGSMRGFLRGGRVMLTSDNDHLKPWRASVAYVAAMHRPAQLLDHALHVSLAFVLPRPPSVSQRRRPLPTTKPDTDKLTRAILDALTGIIWSDDSLVTSLRATKRYADNGAAVGVTVEVEADSAAAPPPRAAAASASRTPSP